MHETYAANGDVLFSKDGKRLIACTRAFDAPEYAVPEGVETIDDWAFSTAPG